MIIFDGHCDVLYKMSQHPEYTFAQSDHLDVDLQRLTDAQVRVQAFAIFVSDFKPRPRFAHILEQIRIFRDRIITHSPIQFIRNRAGLQAVRHDNKKIGAILTLEGADALAANLSYVQLLSDLGVRCLSMTWNDANWAADGALASPHGGLTPLGYELVMTCKRLGIILDVSHLSEASFWDVCASTDQAIYASHSNVHALCPHPRNLRDDQLEVLIDRGATIGLTFVPAFIDGMGEATTADLLRHIDHICALGGEFSLTFGSDFDGIQQHVVGLEHAGRYLQFAELLDKHYTATQTKHFLFENAYDFFHAHLP